MKRFPSLFISHGAPSLAIEACPAHDYLSSLGPKIGQPAAIVLISAHHVARGVAVTTDIQPETIYDFGGFSDALYKITYPAPGAPELAARIVERLRGAGFDANPQPGRGLDHGAWVPLSLIFPDAHIPVVQVSIDMTRSPAWHYALGQALSGLRDQNILIIGSGGATHNLHAFFKDGHPLDAPRPDWVDSFAEWIAERISQGDVPAVLDAVERGPNGRRNHPTMDHILPLFVALGAGGAQPQGARVHESTTYGVLAMDVFGFGKPEDFLPLAEKAYADVR